MAGPVDKERAINIAEAGHAPVKSAEAVLSAGTALRSLVSNPEVGLTHQTLDERLAKPPAMQHACHRDGAQEGSVAVVLEATASHDRTVVLEHPERFQMLARTIERQAVIAQECLDGGPIRGRRWAKPHRRRHVDSRFPSSMTTSPSSFVKSGNVGNGSRLSTTSDGRHSLTLSSVTTMGAPQQFTYCFCRRLAQ